MDWVQRPTKDLRTECCRASPIYASEHLASVERLGTEVSLASDSISAEARLKHCILQGTSILTIE